MKSFIQKLNPEWALRLGLGLMYLYSGYDLFVNPRHWYGFIPRWLTQAVSQVASVESYLRLQGIVEVIIGLLLLLWFLPRGMVRLASFLAMIEMAGILIFVGIDPITFRDIGLLGAAAALVIISFQQHGSVESS